MGERHLWLQGLVLGIVNNMIMKETARLEDAATKTMEEHKMIDLYSGRLHLGSHLILH